MIRVLPLKGQISEIIVRSQTSLSINVLGVEERENFASDC